MEKQRLHIFNRDNHIVIYDIKTMDLFIGDNLNKKNIEQLSNQTFRCTAYNSSIVNEYRNCDKKAMRRVTICVSNDCNLRCKYCYAHGGDYGKKRTLMTKKTARDIVNFCINNFSRIDSITLVSLKIC